MISFGINKSLHYDNEKDGGQIKMSASDGGYDCVDIYLNRKNAAELAKFLIIEFNLSIEDILD